MSSQMRLKLRTSVEATVVCCTPTYALHLVEVAAAEGVSLRESRGPRADRGGGAGRQHSRHAQADRGGLGRARDRPPRAHGSRPGQLRVLGGARVPAPQRDELPVRGARPRDARARARRHARRARRHEPRPQREPGAALPDARRGRAALRALPVRPQLGAARGRDRCPRRRHGERARRERVPDRDRGRAARLPRDRGVPLDGVAQPRDAHAVARDRAGGGPRGAARPSPPRWASACARRSGSTSRCARSSR